MPPAGPPAAASILRVALDSGASVVLAGGAGYGFRDGPGHKARFACPMYLALDPRDCR